MYLKYNVAVKERMILYFDDKKKEETGHVSCFLVFFSFLITFSTVTYTMTFL